MKRFLSLLLVAALVLSVPVAPVFAQTNTTQQEENVTPVTDACPCGCGQKVEDIQWTPIPTNLKGSPADGHHYLTQDFYQGDYGMVVIAGTNVVIDLRGYTWGSNSNKDRLFTVQGNLTILDTVGGGKIAPKIRGAWGGAFLLDTYETANPTLIFASGTMTTAASGNGAPGSAGFIYAMEDSRFIMKGGVIENVSVPQDGGVIHTSGTATVQILGGIIRNCSAGEQGGVINSVQPVTIKNATFINCSAGADGGGVVSSNKKITIENSTFMNCSATGNGGALAISITGASNVKNSTFFGNSAANGGAIYLYSGVSTTTAFTLTNLTIAGNTATGHGGGIYATDTSTSNTAPSFNVMLGNSIILGNKAGAD
jgi:predicted outer membrane repeat protein